MKTVANLTGIFSRMNWKNYGIHLLFSLFSVISYSQSVASLRQMENDLTIKKDTARVDLLNQLSWGYRHINTKKALYFGERATQMSRDLRYWTGLAFSYKNRGTTYSIIGNNQQANVFLKKSLIQFSELNNRTQIGNLHNLFGLMYWETGKYDSALVSYDLALKEFIRTNDWEGKAIVYSNKGIIYYELGTYERALKNYVLALEIGERHNDRRIQAFVHTNIGIIYSALTNYEQAIFHYRSSIRLEDELDNNSGKAKCLTNLGVCFFKMQNMDSSLFYHQKALAIYTISDERKGIAHSLLNIGSIYQEQKNYEKANDYFQKGLAIKQTIQDALGEIIALNNLGRLRVVQGKTDEAIAYLEQAYVQSDQIHSLYYKVETSLLLAQLYEEQGQSKEAMWYYKQHTTANEQLFHELTNQKLAGLLIHVATKKQLQHISTLEKQSKRSNKQHVFLITAIIVLLVLATWLYFHLQRKHHKRNVILQQKIAHNRAELMSYTHHLIEKNSVIEALQIQLEASQLMSNDPLDDHIEQLNKLSLSRIITDDDWEEFKVRFSEVFPQFMTRMKKRFTGITAAELRLAALITLQLNSKEIASILGISSDSVKKSRQRLRKKMALQSEQDLDVFLMEFAK